MNKLPIKIVSDGTMLGTRIVNTETGEPIGGVKALRWEISSADISGPICTIELMGVPIEFEVNADVKHAPPEERTDY